MEEKDILKELGLDGDFPVEKEAPSPVSKLPPKKHCPFCLSEINPRATVCATCRRDQPGFKSPIQELGQNPGIAAAMSVVIPGLGQIYKGKLIQGFCWMVIVPIGYLCFFAPGLVLHILCVTNAYCD